MNRKRILSTLIEFVKFGIVGVSNFIVAMGIYYILRFFGVNYLIANTVGYLLSILNAFVWNYTFVFKKAEVEKIGKKFLKTYVAYGVTYVINTLSLWLLVEMLKVSDIIAPLITLVIVTPINYFMNKLWVHKCKDKNGGEKI